MDPDRLRIAAAIVLALGLGGAPASGAEQAPRLVVDEPVFDFGTVERGATVDHTFRLPNRGDGELRIEHVKGSCGCTVAVLSAREIAPGGEGRVAVTLDTARLSGRTTKVVNLYSNDPERPVTELALTGTVTADLVLTPSPLYLGRVRRGEPTHQEVLITPGGAGTAAIVTAVEHTNPVLQTRLEPRGDGPGQRLVVELGRDMPLGRFNDQLTLHTTSARDPVVHLAVFGSIEGDLIVLPPQVTFGVTRAGATPERELFIRNRGGRPLVLRQVTVPADVVTYDLTTVREGVEYRLALRLRDTLPPGKVEGAIEILTNHPVEDRLVVPLYAIVRPGRPRG